MRLPCLNMAVPYVLKKTKNCFQILKSKQNKLHLIANYYFFLLNLRQNKIKHSHIVLL